MPMWVRRGRFQIKGHSIMRILGIDVGLSGGAAVFDDATNEIVNITDIPVYGEEAQRRVNAVVFRDWIKATRADRAFIELAGSMPEQGIASAFRYGRGTGALEATVSCCDIPWRPVTAQKWKKHFGLKGPDKERSRVYAIREVPGAAKYLERKMDHGRAEALLIAIYGVHVVKTLGLT